MGGEGDSRLLCGQAPGGSELPQRSGGRRLQLGRWGTPAAVIGGQLGRRLLGRHSPASSGTQDAGRRGGNLSPSDQL